MKGGPDYEWESVEDAFSQRCSAQQNVRTWLLRARLALVAGAPHTEHRLNLR